MNRASIVTLVVACALWELVTSFFNIPRYIFPSLTAVVEEMGYHLGLFVTNTGITAAEAALGGVLGCSIGFALGCLMALNRHAENILLPYVIGSNSVPIVAIAPLVALWFGHGLVSKIVVAAF